MELIIAFIALAILATPVLLIVTLAGQSNLKQRVTELEGEVRRLTAQLGAASTGTSPPARTSPQAAAASPGDRQARVTDAPSVPGMGAMPPEAVRPIPPTAPVIAPPPAPSASPVSGAVRVSPASTEVGPSSARTSTSDEGAPDATAAASTSTGELTTPAATEPAPPPSSAPAGPTGPIIEATPVRSKPTGPVIAAAPVHAAPVTPAVPPVARGPRPAPAKGPAEEPHPLEVLVGSIKRWFTEGNVPVKVGVLVMLVGVAALLKYAGDQGWLTITIQMRLGAISVAAIGALAFAWRKRESHRNFSLAVQGGAIGVLLLVVFAAFKVFDLVPAVPAFVITVLLVAALCGLAFVQDALTLAVLGILAGFLAPIWLSTGSGNHVVLFSYYAVLNLGIIGMAWMRPWRMLNLMGWAFTWGIGVAWGVRSYTEAKYASTQPFLLLFFVLYLVLPLLYARRRAAGERDVVDGVLIFGTPLVAFSAQAVLFKGEGTPLSICALGLAAIYAGLWWWKRRGAHPMLGQAYGLLAAGFATLAVPLALSARATSAVFAVEGAAIVWLGLRQKRAFPLWSGTGLQLASALAFAIAADSASRDGLPLTSPSFAGALLITVAGLACAWWFREAGRSESALAFYGWGLTWWGGNAFFEIAAHVEAKWRVDASLAVLALTVLLAAEVHRRRPAPALWLTVLGGFVLAGFAALAQFSSRGQPFEGVGAAAWLVFALCGVRSLLSLRGSSSAVGAVMQFVWWGVWSLVTSLSLVDVAGAAELGSGWRFALPMLPWLLLFALVQFRWRWLRQPTGGSADGARGALLWTALLVVGFGSVAALFLAGDSAPLPWMPLLNPLELVQLGALALAARWLWSDLAPQELSRSRATLVSLAGLVFVTVATLRAVHHLGHVPWGDALWSSNLAQTSLTLVWSVLGVVGWIVGSRRGLRTLWLAGAVLMALVLAKLVLVDRRYLGDLLGIGSFLAYGLMCTLVGWFAPAPPRKGPGPGGDDEAKTETGGTKTESDTKSPRV